MTAVIHSGNTEDASYSYCTTTRRDGGTRRGDWRPRAVAADSGEAPLATAALGGAGPAWLLPRSSSRSARPGTGAPRCRGGGARPGDWRQREAAASSGESPPATAALGEGRGGSGWWQQRGERERVREEREMGWDGEEGARGSFYRRGGWAESGGELAVYAPGTRDRWLACSAGFSERKGRRRDRLAFMHRWRRDGEKTAMRHEVTCRERERRRNMGDARPTTATAGIQGVGLSERGDMGDVTRWWRWNARERERRGSATSRKETATRRRGDGEGTRVRESSGWDGAASAVVATRHGDGTGMTRGGVAAVIRGRRRDCEEMGVTRGDAAPCLPERNRSEVGLGATRRGRWRDVWCTGGRLGATRHCHDTKTVRRLG
ncbi:hypothetical protein DAI22_09g063401 [Oryza sativa Japonica Group]|nr:hypothetical protein DAI22_09g063401 [Oryza sativa Japonica Group]